MQSQKSLVVFKQPITFWSTEVAVRVGRLIELLSSLTTKSRSGRSLERRVPITAQTAWASRWCTSSLTSSVWIEASQAIVWGLTFPKFSSNKSITFEAFVPGKRHRPDSSLLIFLSEKWSRSQRPATVNGLCYSAPWASSKTHSPNTIHHHKTWHRPHEPSRNNRLFCAIQGGSGVACHLGWTRAWRKLHLQRCQAPRKALSARFFGAWHGTCVCQGLTGDTPGADIYFASCSCLLPKSRHKRFLLYSASRTKKIVSPAKVEVYACSSGIRFNTSGTSCWLVDRKAATIHLYADNSGARGFLQRRGGDFASWVAESCGSKTWLDQDLFLDLRSLMSVLGLYKMSTNSVEGSNDPGHMFIKRQSVRMRSLISIDFSAPEMEPESAHVVSAVSILSSNAAIAMQHHPGNIHQSVATPRYSATPWYVLIQLPNVIDTLSKRWRSKKAFNTSPSHIFP